MRHVNPIIADRSHELKSEGNVTARMVAQLTPRPRPFFYSGVLKYSSYTLTQWNKILQLRAPVGRSLEWSCWRQIKQVTSRNFTCL